MSTQTPVDKRFLTIDDLANLPAPVWLIDGMFEAQSLVMLAGPSYSFKSFLMLDWMLCMASGRAWLGRKTAHCKVGYVLGEGKASLFKRIRAWMKYNDLSPQELESLKLNFRVSFDVPQLTQKSSVDNMLAALSDEDFKPEVLAIDTFARSFVGGNENDANDTGRWVNEADRLRQLGYCVVFLHHTKKNTEFGVQYRGSTAIMAAMDTAMTLVREGNGDLTTLKIDKQKDHAEEKPLRFKRLIVRLSDAKDDDSCVLVPGPIKIDTKFQAEPEEVVDIDTVTRQLIADPSFANDARRAEVLALRAGITVAAAKVRISYRKGLEKPKVESVRLNPILTPSLQESLQPEVVGLEGVNLDFVE